MQFDKSKVYTALNADELKVGSKCIFADKMKDLREYVESDDIQEHVRILTAVCDDDEMERFEADYITYSLAYLVEPPKEYFDELFRVSKNQIIWGGNYFRLPPVRGFAIWDKCQPFPNFSACEFAWTSFDCPSKIFHFDNRYGGKIHPTQKPVELYKWLLSKYAEHGWTIIDTHLGSGSSRIAAYDMGFDFIGLEIDAEYFEKQEARFKEYCAQGSLFEFQGGVCV